MSEKANGTRQGTELIPTEFLRHPSDELELLHVDDEDVGEGGKAHLPAGRGIKNERLVPPPSWFARYNSDFFQDSLDSPDVLVAVRTPVLGHLLFSQPPRQALEKLYRLPLSLPVLGLPKLDSFNR